MAFGDYTAVEVLDVFDELGNEESGFYREFMQQERGNFEAVRLFSDSTPGLIPLDRLEMLMQEKVHPNQQIFVDVNEPTTPGTSTQYRRKGVGGNDRRAVEIADSALIEEGFEISAVNEAFSRFSTYSDKDRIMYSIAYLIGQKSIDMMVRLNNAIKAFADTNKWTAGGVGTVFTAAGDFKEIPAGAGSDTFLQVEQEAFQNKFNMYGSQRFNILGDAGTRYFARRAEEFGANNTRNQEKQLNSMDFYFDSELTVPTPATDYGIFYALPKNAVGVYSAPHRFYDGERVETGEDFWEMIKLPQLPMFEGINTDLLNVSLKGFKGFTDNFATYSIEEARIDIVTTLSMVMKPYIFFAPSPTGSARRPFVGYIIRK